MLSLLGSVTLAASPSGIKLFSAACNLIFTGILVAVKMSDTKPSP